MRDGTLANLVMEAQCFIDIAGLRLRRNLIVGPRAIAIVSIDAFYLTEWNYFTELSKAANQTAFLFLHHLDTVETASINENDLLRRTVEVSTEAVGGECQFESELPDYDSVTTNFDKGLVMPKDFTWAGVCMHADGIAAFLLSRECIAKNAVFSEYLRERVVEI